MAYSILEITDGTVSGTVSFISKDVGLHLKSWNPSINPFKDDGVWQDSSQGPGRRLVQSQFANAIETFTFDLNGRGQDDLIRELTKFLELLLAAINYWETERGDPIYIRAKSPCETGIRYCEVRGFSLPGLKNPYAAPFFAAQELAAMEEIELSIERLFWLANPPGTGECLPIRSISTWQAGQEIISSNIDTVFLPADMVEADNGDLFLSTAASKATLRRSQDGGVTWGTVAVAPAANQFALRKASNGYLFLTRSGAEIWRSTNDGAVWSMVLSSPLAPRWGFAEDISTGDLYAGGQSLWKSIDDGASWTNILDLQGAIGSISDVFIASNGYIFLVTPDYILRSTDGGTAWETVFRPAGLSGFAGTMVENFRGLLVSYDAAIFISYDFGDRWSELFTTGFSSRGDDTNNIFLRKFDENTLYSLWQPGVYISTDAGLTWSLIHTPPVGNWASLVLYITTGGEVFIVDGETATGNLQNVLKVNPTSYTFGGENENCDDPPETLIINKFAQAQLTHVKIDDGGAFTDLMPMTVFPVVLFPASPADEDALYFISDTSLGMSGQFDNVAFFLSETIQLVTAPFYVITWEYWDGAAWTTIPDFFDGTFQFSQNGPCSVHFSPPIDWDTATVDGVTGWAIRARFSTLSGTIVPPEQGTRSVFSQNQPFIEGVGTVAGDIPALLRMLLRNISDMDGRSDDANFYDNRVIVGLRSFEEESAFQAFINISDAQEPFGISVTAGSDTTFTDDNTAPTGRVAVYNPAGVEAMDTRATVSIGPSIARGFYGTFHAYLRGQRTAGTITDISVRLQIVTGSGGIFFTTEERQFQTTTAFELLDFGQIDIPASGAIKDDEIPDVLQILIQASAASGTPDLNLYDLVLIPVDEWALDSIDITNSDDSIVGRVIISLERMLDIDSIAYPVLDIRTIVRTATDKIVSIWNPITGGEAIAQAGLTGRYWVLSAQTSATGASYSWIAPPDIAHSVQAFKNERYLALRGDR